MHQDEEFLPDKDTDKVYHKIADLVKENKWPNYFTKDMKLEVLQHLLTYFQNQENFAMCKVVTDARDKVV